MKAYTYPEDQVKRLIAQTSRSLFEEKFPSRNFIEGDEILSFCSHPQINRFLLFQIYQEWNLYMTKLKHPYFDFQHTEVRDAIHAFQNILSQHIKVQRADFKPLLDKAVYNSFRLILQPFETLSGFFFLNKEQIPVDQFGRYVHYFSDFDFIVGSLASYYRKHNVDEIDKEEFFEKSDKLAELYVDKTEQTMDEYRGILFHKLTGMELKELLDYQPIEPVKEKPMEGMHFSESDLDSALGSRPTARKDAPARDIQPKASLPPQITKEDIAPLHEIESLAKALWQSAESPKSETPPSKPAPSVSHPSTQENQTSAPKPHPIPPIVEQPKSPPVEQAQQPVPPQKATESRTLSSDVPSRLMDRFQTEKRSLNSQFSQGSKQNVIELSNIPMHKQFQYVQKVFAGNRKLFLETLDALNGTGSMEEAEKYLRERILNMPEVNREDPVTLEFMDLIRNRF